MTNSKTESSVAALLSSRIRAPRGFGYQRVKKLRGQRRYYQKIRRKAQAFSPDLSIGHWCDYWHYHADWPGYGNLSWKHRKTHLSALCTVFVIFVRSTEEYDQPFQLWLYLDRDDAGQDAVYFHTPNPNGDGNHFPAKFNGMRWGVPSLEEFFTSLLGVPVRAGVEERTDGNCVYHVYSPAHGKSLETD